MKTCACIKNTNHMIAQARAGGGAGGRAGGRGEGEDTKCWERTRAEETVSCFILLKARLKQHFLSRDTVVLLKQSESLSLFSSPSSHDLAYRNRDEPEHEAAHFGLFIFLLSLFSPPPPSPLPFFFWYISSCWLQMPHKPTSLYWKHYWREFGWITAALCMSETSEGLSLSLALLSRDVKVSPRWRVEKLRWIDQSSVNTC